MQSGGGKCKLCKSEGANQATCPLNPDAKKHKPKKHYLLLKKKSKSPSKSLYKSKPNKTKKRCPNGMYRSKKTGECKPKKNKQTHTHIKKDGHTYDKHINKGMMNQ